MRLNAILAERSHRQCVWVNISEDAPFLQNRHLHPASELLSVSTPETNRISSLIEQTNCHWNVWQSGLNGLDEGKAIAENRISKKRTSVFFSHRHALSMRFGIYAVTCRM